MMRKSAAVGEAAPIGAHRVKMASLDPDRGQRHRATGKAFAQSNQVRNHIIMLAGKPAAGAAHAAQHLVQDQQDIIPVADLTNDIEIPRRRRIGGQGAAADGFGQKGGDRLRAHVQNGLFQGQGAAQLAIGQGESV